MKSRHFKMEQFGNLYSQYYDLLYSDKDYEGEVNYIDNLIKTYFKKAKSILDLGCGTGRHAELFTEKGYFVHGIDISEDMIKIAERRRIGKEDKLSFKHCNLHNLKLSKYFDVIVSLFHVLSYQNTNKEVINFFNVAKRHLTENGILIFDFWYGPAVLTIRPTIKIKRLENENIRLIRIADPILVSEKNIVEVNYSVFLEDKKIKELVEKKEIHSMRYFFDKELELFCDLTGFKILTKHAWLSKKKPSVNSWSVVWVVKK